VRGERQAEAPDPLRDQARDPLGALRQEERALGHVDQRRVRGFTHGRDSGRILTRLVDVDGRVLALRRRRVGGARRISALFIIVPELDDDVVPGRHAGEERAPVARRRPSPPGWKKG
jgi:hypothetical protein